MVDDSPEAAMRRACDFILQGDLYSAMADLTPEAMNEAMALANELSGLSLPERYVIESHTQSEDGAHRFGVLFTAGTQQLRASATWRQFAGAWKIASLSVEGLR
jgi:hypothetical protein